MTNFNKAKEQVRTNNIVKLGKYITENASEIDSVLIIDNAQRKQLNKIGKELKDDQFVDSFSRGLVGILYAFIDKTLTKRDIERIIEMCDKTAKLQYRQGAYDSITAKSTDVAIDRISK